MARAVWGEEGGWGGSMYSLSAYVAWQQIMKPPREFFRQISFSELLGFVPVHKLIGLTVVFCEARYSLH
jgi:hypothetical protein